MGNNLSFTRFCGSAILVAALGAGTEARAVEGAVSFYMPGGSVPSGGVLPPEGIYLDDATYLYRGKFKAGRTTELGGNQALDVRVNVWANYPTVLWVTPLQFLGGNVALSATAPFGEPRVRAGAVLDGPLINQALGGPLRVSARDATVNIGDPVVASSIGWHAGNWHWKVGAAVNIPAGNYERGELSNIALHRWLGDFSAGLTYLDPTFGLDVSAVAGFIVNGANPATNYRSGNEFHVDGSVSKNLTKEISLGALVSYYEQMTADSGTGARVGSFKGRALAVGGVMGLNFNIGQLPVSARVKVLRELEVENRPRGTIGWVQLTVPLWTAPPPNVSERIASR